MIFKGILTFRQKVRFLTCYLRAAPKGLSDNEQRSHQRYHSIALAGVTATASRIITALISFATVPMVINHIGKDLYGLWMVVSSLVVWMQLADFGITNGLTNSLAEANGRDDIDAASHYLSSAFIATHLISLICIPLLLIAYLGVDWESILNINDPGLAVIAAKALLVIGVAFIINIPLSLAGRVFVAYQKSHIYNNSLVLASLLSFLGLWLAVKMELGIIWLIAVSAFVPVLANLSLWFLLPRLDKRLKIHIKGVNRRALKRISQSSVPLFFFQLGALLVNQLVNVFIAQLASLALVADYNVVLRIYIFVFSLAAALSSPFYAAIREAFERKDFIWSRQALKNSLLVRLSAIIPFSLVLVLLGDSLLQLWLGQMMIKPIGAIGWGFISLSLVMASVSSLLSELLTSLDDIWSQVGLVFLTAITVLGFLICFIPSFGVSGVFLAMALSTVLPMVLCAFRLKRKFICI